MRANLLKITGFFIIFTTVVTGVTEATEPKSFGKKDIDSFCEASSTKSRNGIQFNNEKANQTVLQLRPGKYTYPNNGRLLLFENNRYLMKLPDGYNGVYGTDGDDLLVHGGIVGGCSKEQLSEAIQNNGLQPQGFELIKRNKK